MRRYRAEGSTRDYPVAISKGTRPGQVPVEVVPADDEPTPSSFSALDVLGVIARSIRKDRGPVIPQVTPPPQRSSPPVPNLPRIRLTPRPARGDAVSLTVWAQFSCGHGAMTTVDRANVGAAWCVTCRELKRIHSVSSEPPEQRPAWRQMAPPAPVRFPPRPVVPNPLGGWVLVPAGNGCRHNLALPLDAPATGRALCPGVWAGQLLGDLPDVACTATWGPARFPRKLCLKVPEAEDSKPGSGTGQFWEYSGAAVFDRDLRATGPSSSAVSRTPDGPVVTT